MTTQINQLTELTTTSDGDLLLIRENATGVDKKMQASNLRAKATTKGDVGLGDVDNVSAASLRDRSTHTGTQPLSTISDAGTIASQDSTNVNIDGGTIDGTAVNATTLTASGDVNFDSGTLFVDESTNRVGIGTTAPGARLDVVGGNMGVSTVAGRTYSTGIVSSTNPNIVNGSGFNSIPIKVGDIITFFGGQVRTVTSVTDTQLTVNSAWTTSYAGVSATGKGGIGFDTNDTERMRITSSGHAIIPAGVTLGTSVGVYNAANTLDDYETGTWTPIIGGVDGQSGQTYSLQSGTYTKIGDRVYCSFDAVLTAKGTITGRAAITNLPFASSGNFSGQASFSFFNDLGSNVVFLSLTSPINASTLCEIRFLSSANTSINNATTAQISNTTRLIGGVSYRV